MPGNFSSSAFVEKTVGVDNVCERSAMAAAPQGILLARKYAKDGVTVAIAMHTFFRYLRYSIEDFYNAFADDNKITKGRLLV